MALFTPANPNDPASDFQATVAWGDGSQSTATLTSDGNGHLVVSGSHTWTDESPAGIPYGVTVTVVSAQNPTQSPLTESTTVAVADAALTASGSSFATWAGQPSGQVLVASFTDANPLSSVSDFTASITWGDGVGSSQGVVEANGSGGYDVYGAYTYQNAGSYTVTVNITDDGGSTATATSTATVTTPAASLSATEGAVFSGTVASFSGQDTTQLSGSATITWGDGSQSAGTITGTGPSSFTVSGSHTYQEEGLDPLTVTVGLVGGSNLVGQGMGVIQDAALSATGTNVTATVSEATGLVQVADFTDADPSGTLTDYTASINWGDGNVSTGQIQSDGNGGFAVLGNHTYLFSGSFTISTNIQDAGGSSTVATSLAQAPDTSATGIAAMEGTDFEYIRPITINLAAGQAPPSSFTATLYWGDGTSSQGVVVDTALNGSTLTATVTADHIYSEDGLYVLTTTVTGSDGNVYSPTIQTIDVADAPLTAGVVSLTAVATSTPAAPVQVADFYDGNLYGAAGDFTATIDWGDGSGTTTGTVQALGAGHFAVLGSHTYASAGKDTVTVNVIEDGGSSVQISGAVTVQAPWAVIPAVTGTRGDDPSQAYLLTYGEATVDVNLGALRLSQQLDFDQSPGTDVGRNPSLVYNSATVDVQPVVQIGLTGVQGIVPAQIAVQLTWNNVPQSTVYFTPSASQQSYLLSVPVQGAVTQSGAYNWSATITITLPGNQTVQTTTSGVSYVVSRDNSPYGAGWGIDGIDQLVVGSTGALLVTGQGDSRFFSSNGNGTFTSPPEDFGSLVQNLDGTYTYTAHDQSEETFNAQGLMTSFVDRDNLTTTYQYGSQGQLTQVNSIDGGVTTLNYTGGLLSSIVEPGNRTLSFSHDTSGNLTTITDADNNGRTFGYDSNHHVVEDQWSPLNATFTYNTSNGQLTEVNLGQGTAYTIVSAASAASVSATGQAQATVTDGMGGKSTYVLDMRGRLLQETDPMGYVTTYQLDQAGEVLQETDPMNRVTSFRYSNGNMTQVIYADGSSTQYSYNRFAEVTQQADSSGETTSYGYNGTGDLTSFTDATGATTGYTWANGLMTSETDPGQNGPETITYYYDTDRRQIESIDALGAPAFTSYDVAGNVSATWDALGEETQSTTDGNNQVIETIAANGAVTTEAYNAYGEVTSSTDGRGLTSSTTFDQRGWDTRDTDPTGASTETFYDADGDVTETIDPDQHATHFTFDADNRQTGETDALGYSSITTYDADSEVLKTVDAMGRTDTDVYNVMGEQVLNTDPMGRTVVNVYDSEGNVVASQDAQGWTLNQYDADNRQIATTNPGGETTRTVYDAAGDVAETIDAMGYATTYQFDADNRQVKVTDADGHSEETVYNAIGEETGSIDARGYETSYYYDTVGDQIGVLDPTGDLTQTVYDADGNAIVTIDPRGGTTIDTYDADNRVIAEENGDGFWSRMGYDSAGNETISIDDNGNATYTSFDADNRAVLTVDPDGHDQQTVYDPDSEVIASINGDGHGIFSAFDADGEQVTQRDADGNVTQTPMNADGEQADETDPDGNTWTYFFDANGNQVGTFTTSADDTQGSYTLSVFDADNRLTSSTDADGRKITYAYDNMGNLLTETWFSSNGQVTDTQTYTYDADNNVLTAANNQGQYSYTYDKDGRVSTQTDPWGLTLTYGYDNNGNVVSVQDSLGGVLTSVYDADNQLVTREFTGTGQTPMRLDLTYTPDGQMATETYSSNLAGTQVIGVATYGYDAAGNLTSLVDTNGSSTVIASYSYVYDPANLLLSENDSGTVTNYAYDPAGQLVSAGSQVQTYDSNGNRTDPSYVTGAGNELLSDGTWNYTYDDAGNLTTKTGISNGLTWTYGYDDANRLISAVESNSSGMITSETLKYDVYGNLIEQDVYTASTGQTVTTRYAIDQNGNVWADLSGSNALEMRRLYLDGPNEMYARIAADGTLNAYMTDHLGSVRIILSAAGIVVDALTYDAWGNLVSESDPSEGDREKWAGLVFDMTTGLYGTTNRYYDPTTGRWQGVDPDSFAAGSSNLYEYVANSPTNAVDLLGLQTTDIRIRGLTLGRNTEDTQWEFSLSWKWSVDKKNDNVLYTGPKSLPASSISSGIYLNDISGNLAAPIPTTPNVVAELKKVDSTFVTFHTNVSAQTGNTQVPVNLNDPRGPRKIREQGYLELRIPFTVYSVTDTKKSVSISVGAITAGRIIGINIAKNATELYSGTVVVRLYGIKGSEGKLVGSNITMDVPKALKSTPGPQVDDWIIGLPKTERGVLRKDADGKTSKVRIDVNTRLAP